MTTETYKRISLDDAMRAQLETPRVADTSLAAYLDRVISGRAGAGQQRCYEAIRAAGEHGITLDELVVSTGMLIQSASGDLTALKNRGAIKRNNTTRPTRTGREAHVWVAATSEGASA